MPKHYVAILSSPELSPEQDATLHEAVDRLGGSRFHRVGTSAQRTTLPSGAFSFEAESAREIADRLELISLPAQVGVALRIDFAVIEVAGDACFGGVEVDDHGTRLFREDRTRVRPNEPAADARPE